MTADAVVVILATRDAAHVDAQLTGVPKLHVPGLDLEPAIVLLRSALPAPIDPAAAAQIAVATGGNPLALLDLATELATDADGVTRLAESTLANEPVPIGPHLEAFYMQTVRSLAAETQLWLLLAAADSTGDLALIGAAGVALGVPESASEAAESAGLVELGVDGTIPTPAGEGSGLRRRHRIPTPTQCTPRWPVRRLRPRPCRARGLARGQGNAGHRRCRRRPTRTRRGPGRADAVGSRRGRACWSRRPD